MRRGTRAYRTWLVLAGVLPACVAGAGSAAYAETRAQTESGKYLALRPSKPKYASNEKAWIWIDEKSWPTELGYRLEVQASLDGASAPVTDIGTHLHALSTPPLSPGYHHIEASAFVVNQLKIDTLNHGISDLNAEIAKLEALLSETQDPAQQADLQHQIAEKQKMIEALRVQISQASQLEETVELDLMADSDSPQIALDPADGSLIRIQEPTIHISYSDVGVGVDLRSLNVLFDGQDVSSRLVMSPTEATLQFTQDWPLPQGSHELQIRLADFAGNVASEVAHYTADYGTITQNYIVGSVTDATGAPLPGATVTNTIGPVSVRFDATTDAQGMYRIPFQTGGHYILFIHKAGYTYGNRVVDILSGSDAVVDPVKLTQNSSPVIHVDPTQNTSVSTASGDFSVNLPAGFLSAPADVTAINYSSGDSLPGSLPETSAFTYCQSVLGADGSPLPSSAKSVSSKSGRLNCGIARFGNTLGFPGGTTLPVGSYSPITASWSAVGTGTISGDGSEATYSVCDLIPHDPNMPVVPPPSAIYAGAGGFNGGDGGSPGGCKSACCGATVGGAPGGSSSGGDGGSSGTGFGGGGADDGDSAGDGGQWGVENAAATAGVGAGGSPGGGPSAIVSSSCVGGGFSLDTGNLFQSFGSTAVIRRNTSYSIRFTYNSLAAAPSVLVGTGIEAKPAAGTPDSVGATFKFQGQEISSSFEGDTGILDSVQRVLLEGKSVDGQQLPSGSYPFSANLSTYYKDSQYASATYFGAPPGTILSVIAREPAKLSETYNGRVVVQNESLSPFGAGWSLQGQEKITVGADGSALWRDGNGDAESFMPLQTSSGTRHSGILRAFERLSRGRESAAFTSISSDPQGFIYVTSCQANRVYRVDLAGHATVVAGNGERGFLGDGGAATAAELSCPAAVASAKRGGFYISDSGNFRIRYVHPDGTIETVAGNGTIEQAPDQSQAKGSGIGRPGAMAEDEMQALQFVTGNEIRTINPFGKLETLSSKTGGYVPADLSKPSQILFDEHANPLIVDTEHQRIVRLLLVTEKAQVLLGEGSRAHVREGPSLQEPIAMVFDPLLKRYFILEKSGRVMLWEGPGHRVLIPVAKVAAPNPLLAWSPEAGLIAPGEIEMSSMRALGTKLISGQIAFQGPPGDHSTLIQNADGSWVRKLPSGAISTFDSQGYIVARTEADGRSVGFVYGDGHRLDAVTVPGGDRFVFAYDSRGFLSSVTDPTGQVTKVQIDAEGNLTQVTDPTQSTMAYGYDGNHLLSSKTDPVGRITGYEYRAGRVTAEIQADGKRREISPAALVGLINDQSIFVKAGTALAPVVPQSSVVGQVVSAEGRVSSTRVDSQGRSASWVDGDGNATTYNLSNDGNVQSSFTPAGRLSTFTYYSDGGLLESSQTAVGKTQYEYDPRFALASKITDQDGNSLLISYTDQGKTASVSDAENHTTQMGYHPDGTLQTITDARSNMTQFEEDAEGNLSAVIDALSRRTEYHRDAAGRVTEIRDPAGHLTDSMFDARGRLLQTTDALGGKTKYSYYPDGLLSSITDAKNQTTTFKYNSLRFLTSQTNALNQTESYLYDSDGNLTERTTRNGAKIEYSYDNASRLVSKTAGGVLTQYTQDKDGLLTKVTKPDSEVDLQYDDQGRLIQDLQSGDPNGGLNYTIADDGRVSELDWGGSGTLGVHVAYSYNPEGLLDQIDAQFFGESYHWARTTDELLRPSQDLLPNGIVSSYTWDAVSELQELKHILPDGSTILSDLLYGYSPTGDRTTLSEVIGPKPAGTKPAQTGNWAYDELDRLVSAVAPDESFQYDSVGNRTEDSQVYDAANRLLSDESFSYAWDADGNLLSKVGKSADHPERIDYTWDAEDHLTRAVVSADGHTPQWQIDYRYDGLGRRIERSAQNLLDPTQSYDRQWVYDGSNIFAEYDGATRKLLAMYLHGPGIDHPVLMLRDRNGDGKFDRSKEAYIYTQDGLGSTQTLTDMSGALEQRYRYSAYGVPHIEKVASDPADHDLIENPFSYTGREWEPETGEYFYRARYLSPETGSFISRDPIGFDGGDINLYRDVGDSPLNLVDPSGLASCAYIVSTHTLSCTSSLPNGPSYGTSSAVSGHGSYADDPTNFALTNLGPLPPGNYIIGSLRPGRFPSFSLTPTNGTSTFGRSGFLLHGCGNTATCSEGCLAVYGNSTLRALSGLLTLDALSGFSNTLSVSP